MTEAIQSVADILGAGGAIARRLRDYEPRPEQLTMAMAVESALQNRHHLVAEAGTGVGKSFAYLIPAILAAQAERGAENKKRRIIVSTHTISLQEQLITHDIPFLQSVLHDFDLLPLAIGLAPPAQVARALEAVWNGPETLVVVSSDLSHYHASTEARHLDEQASRSILELRSDLSDEQACGARAINGLMEVARLKGLRVELLDLRNSGDTAGDRSRVVGYGSYAFYEARA